MTLTVVIVDVHGFSNYFVYCIDLAEENMSFTISNNLSVENYFEISFISCLLDYCYKLNVITVL
jgi:hypothetical protein